MERSVWIGFDPRETDGYAVTRTSLERHANTPIPVRGLVLADLQKEGLYTRDTRLRDGKLFDAISKHEMATEFAISRFFVPLLVKRERGGRAGNPWAVFMDSDVLVCDDIHKLFDLADPKYAVQVVRHTHTVKQGLKMDGQVQTPYARKNWSSVILFNVNHPANDALDLSVLNTTKGISLHQFSWLPDQLIGELPVKWNFLEGYNTKEDLTDWGDRYASILHFTEGLPSMGLKFQGAPNADAWFEELHRWAR